MTALVPARTGADVGGLLARLRRAWSGRTSSDPAWTPTNPALGQCAVTALVVQDALGGSLLRSTVRGRAHYWNLLPDGTEFDATRTQFPEFLLDGPAEERTREYALSFPDTASRYELLRAGVINSTSTE